ncbi:MAG: DUF2892 domain-containing protein [Fibrobacteres bacterium]|nr:DUF2892 domain-containing protein [Fibrobacterota bacterium]
MPSNSPAQNQGSFNRLEDASVEPEPDRIRRLTFKQDLERIDKGIRESVRKYAKSDPSAISRRLMELDSEWPVERALMAGAGSFVWVGLILGTTIHRRLTAMSAIAGAMLLAFALFGWAPPVLFMRRLGIRTQREINRERIALKALRGDFNRLDEGQPDEETRVERALKSAKSQG